MATGLLYACIVTSLLLEGAVPCKVAGVVVTILPSDWFKRQDAGADVGEVPVVFWFSTSAS